MIEDELRRLKADCMYEGTLAITVYRNDPELHFNLDWPEMPILSDSMEYFMRLSTDIQNN